MNIRHNYEHFQRTLTSREVKIRPKSANIAGLQLADILAHPVKQGMLVEKGLIQDSVGSFGQGLREVSEKKFNKRAANFQVEGYGKVWL